MASAHDKAFKILTEREICELLKDAPGRTPAKNASFSVYDESEGGTYPPYWGTWGSAQARAPGVLRIRKTLATTSADARIMRRVSTSPAAK